MGQEIPTDHFSDQDFVKFSALLEQETNLLKQYFEQEQFCNLHHIGGFEIEAWLVDQHAMPIPGNERFLQLMQDPMVVMELSRFNIELNVTPRQLQECALKAMHTDIEMTWSKCLDKAHSMDANLMVIGIHPGIEDSDLCLENMSESTRYKALNEQILAQRHGRPMLFDIRGEERLQTSHHDVMLESAATSFQIHLQVRPHKAVRAMNAAMIASAPLLAVSANSPYLFGHDLWDESRIPLFEQSVDDGTPECKRVSFGTGYIKNSLLECFEENLAVFPPLLPIEMNDSSERFSHLRLHNGTIWRWNRPLIGFTDNERAHLRIENRVVPAGPTVVDMIANAAFFWGLVRCLTEQEMAPEETISFNRTKENFYAAARHSLKSDIQWLNGKTVPVRTLLTTDLLDMAVDGLMNLDIDEEDIEYYLGIIRERAASGQNGAVWQRRWVAEHGRDRQGLSQAYLENQNTGKPVHEWAV